MAEIEVSIRVHAKSGSYDTKTIASVEAKETTSDVEFNDLKSSDVKLVVRNVERIVEDAHEKIEAQLAGKRKTLAKEEADKEEIKPND